MFLFFFFLLAHTRFLLLLIKLLFSLLLLLLQALLFLFLAESCSLLSLLDSHQVRQNLIRLVRCLIGKLLTLLNNFDAYLVTPLNADGQWSVTRLVSLEDVDLGVVEDVGQYFFVENRASCQVQDVRSCTALFDALVGVLGEQDLDHFEARFWTDECKLEGCEVVHLWLQLVCQVFWRLIAPQIDILVS